MKSDLKTGGILGPVYGLPEIDKVDFTFAGAKLWLEFCKRRYADRPRRPFAYPHYVHDKVWVYFRTLSFALAGIEEAKQEADVVSVSDPIAIGPWRVQWWRQFPEGYRVQVERRSPENGFWCTGGEYCCEGRSPEAPEQEPLKAVLDRRNVTLAQWHILSDAVNGYCSWNGEPDELCAANEECLQYGWVCVLDQAAIDEVHRLLEEDAAFLAVPRIARLIRTNHEYAPIHNAGDPIRLLPFSALARFGELDLSSAGAMLYRNISAEWLGPNWESNLLVSNTYYWEEHAYGEAEEDFGEILEGHWADGHSFYSRRLLEIGPWCVHWWNRFPRGLRLELKLGQP